MLITLIIESFCEFWNNITPIVIIVFIKKLNENWIGIALISLSIKTFSEFLNRFMSVIKFVVIKEKASAKSVKSAESKFGHGEGKTTFA